MKNLLIKKETIKPKFNNTSQLCIDFIPTFIHEEIIYNGKLYYVRH